MPIFGYRPMKKEPDPEPDGDEELLDAEQTWRFEQFEALGFNVFSCFVLALKGADYRRAARLLKKNPDHDWVYDQLC